MKKNDNGSKLIELTLDRLEEDQAVLLFGDKEIILPKELLFNETKEGDVLTMTLQTEVAEREQREKTAKELLNEILNGK